MTEITLEGTPRVFLNQSMKAESCHMSFSVECDVQSSTLRLLKTLSDKRHACLHEGYFLLSIINHPVFKRISSSIKLAWAVDHVSIFLSHFQGLIKKMVPGA